MFYLQPAIHAPGDFEYTFCVCPPQKPSFADLNPPPGLPLHPESQVSEVEQGLIVPSETKRILVKEGK